MKRRDWLQKIINKKYKGDILLACKKLKLARTTLYYYISGDRTPRVPVAKRIASPLGVKWEKFYE
jgi:hypothetical protein